MLTGFLLFLFILVSFFMMLVILIQRPRGGGLSGAFGAGGAQEVFGSKTGDVLTWFTVGCFVCYVLLAMGLTWTIKPARQPSDKPTVNTTPQPTTPAGQATPTTPGSGNLDDVLKGLDLTPSKKPEAATTPAKPATAKPEASTTATKPATPAASPSTNPSPKPEAATTPAKP
jgi:preprotein translocase subunit SecG